MKKLPPCLNPKCRKRKVLCFVTSSNLTSPHPVDVPIHSLADYKFLMKTDRRQRDDFPKDKEFMKV